MNLLCNILIISTYWMHCIQYTIEPYSVYDCIICKECRLLFRALLQFTIVRIFLNSANGL